MILIFKLPPPGLIIRDLTINALSPLSSLQKVKSIRNEGDKVVLEIPQGYEGEALCEIFQVSLFVANTKIKSMFSPRMGKNDANTIVKFGEEIRKPINKDISILEFAYHVINWANNESLNRTNEFIMSFNSLKIKPSSLILGGERFAALQLFKVEKYEYGKDYMKSHDEIKMQIRYDIHWLALLMAGFVLTYSGFLNNEMIFITYPEEVIFHERFAETTHAFLPIRIFYNSEKGISILAHRVGTFDQPLAFFQLLSFELVHEWHPNFRFDLLSQALIHMYRVRIGNTYTLVEKNIADLAPFTRFAYKLITSGNIETLRKIENLLKNRYGLEYSGYYSIATKLYQAISGAYDVYSLIYEIGRLRAKDNRVIFHEDDIKGIVHALST